MQEDWTLNKIESVTRAEDITAEVTTYTAGENVSDRLREKQKGVKKKSWFFTWSKVSF